MKYLQTIVLKCETQKSKAEFTKPVPVWEYMLSVATTYNYYDNTYKIWSYTKKDELIKYLNDKAVVCFNGIGFDLPLVIGEGYKCEDDFNIVNKNFRCYVVDIFYYILQQIYNAKYYSKIRDIMFKKPIVNKQIYSLLSIYVATTGNLIDKNIYNVQAIEMFKSKRILELLEYNLFKLRLVKQIYEHIVDHKYVINGDFDVVRIENIPEPNKIESNILLPF